MLRYKVVGWTHKICHSNPPKDLDRHMKRFWKRFDLGGCSGAAVAYHKKKVVGFFRFDKENKSLYACGTYVLRPYRADGVAKKLWIRALKRAKPKFVEVYTASKGGVKLVASVKKKFKKIAWHVSKK